MSHHYRTVDRHVVHGELLDFRALCAAAVPSSTRFLVLDLDRTLHLARNMGEYMGWEMSALHSYGPDYLEKAEATRDTSRFLLDAAEPVAAGMYMLRGVRAWAYPGMFYLLWGRIAGQFKASRRLRHRLFGAEPFSSIQSMPTLALLHELSGVSVDTASVLADRLMTRFAGDQVFDGEDIAWLRERCPGVRIVLSSASPRPTVEAAAKMLGIQEWECGEIEVADGRFSTPYQLSPLFLRDSAPQRISPPSRYRINSGRAKVQRLLERYPDMAQSEVVGISDTWHGEDHCWTDHFTRVVDVNSISPFPPLVRADSPIRAIHSVQLLTRDERSRRLGGETRYLDPRRLEYLQPPIARDASSRELAAVLRDISQEVDVLAARTERAMVACAPERENISRRLDVVTNDLEDAVAAYNVAVGEPSSSGNLTQINRLVRRSARLRRQYARCHRVPSQLALRLAEQLAAGRRAIEATGAEQRRVAATTKSAA